MSAIPSVPPGCKRITLDGDKGDYLDWQARPDGTVEIVDVAVNSERRVGKGRRLVEVLFNQLEPRTRVWAITRADNLIAQQWYESLQFECIAALRRYYGHEKSADALMFGRKAGGPV